MYEFKYLGVIFDHRFNWKAQTNYIVKKCEKRLNFMRSVAGSNWGAHPDSLLMLYKTTILSILEYGCIAFRHLKNCHRIKLMRIQWRALRLSLGLMRSTHTSSLEVLAGVMPLDLRWQKLSDKQI